MELAVYILDLKYKVVNCCVFATLKSNFLRSSLCGVKDKHR